MMPCLQRLSSSLVEASLVSDGSWGRFPVKFADFATTCSIWSNNDAMASKVFGSGSTYPLGGRRTIASKPPSPHSAVIFSFTSTVAWRSVAQEARPVWILFVFQSVSCEIAWKCSIVGPLYGQRD